MDPAPPPPPAPSPPSPPATPAPRRFDSVLYCLKVFLSVRIGLFLLGLLAVALIPANEGLTVPGWAPGSPAEPWHGLFTAWERWDALWFLRIADSGYSPGDGSAAFFPLYPLLVRGVSSLIGGHPLAAALIVSNLCYLGGLVVVHALTEHEWGRRMADKTVLYMAIFPTAFFYVAPFSESLFLVTSVAALLAARRDHWGPAAAAGALAAATRSIGVLLVLPLLLEAVSRWREDRAVPALARRAALALGPGLGTFAYLWFWKRTTGNFWEPLTSQGGWERELQPFWLSLVDGTRAALDFIGTYSAGYHQVDLILVAVALAAAAWVVRKARLTYSVYTVASLLMPLSLVYGGRPFMSLPRFVLPLFPLFWALARFGERFKAHDLVVAVSAAGLGILTVLFCNWYFIF